MSAFEAGTQVIVLANNTRIIGSKLTAQQSAITVITIINYRNYLFCSAAGLDGMGYYCHRPCI